MSVIKGPAIGSKRQAHSILDIYILVILVSKQFASFLHYFFDSALKVVKMHVRINSRLGSILAFRHQTKI